MFPASFRKVTGRKSSYWQDRKWAGKS